MKLISAVFEVPGPRGYPGSPSDTPAAFLALDAAAQVSKSSFSLNAVIVQQRFNFPLAGCRSTFLTLSNINKVLIHFRCTRGYNSTPFVINE